MILSLSAVPTIMTIIYQTLKECQIMYIISFDPHYITTLWSSSCSSHFMAENTEAQRDEWTCPRSHSWCAAGQKWKTNVWQQSQSTQRFSMRRVTSFIPEAVHALKWLLNSLASWAATADWSGSQEDVDLSHGGGYVISRFYQVCKRREELALKWKRGPSGCPSKRTKMPKPQG